MKRLFYLCAALLCLSLAFHFGYTTARAQAPGNPVVSLIFQGSGAGIPPGFYAMTADGTMYQSGPGSTTWGVFNHISGGPTSVASLIFVGNGQGTPGGFYAMTADGTMYQNNGSPNWALFNNVFSGGPTPALHESWGSLKARYAPQSAPVLQAPTNK